MDFDRILSDTYKWLQNNFPYRVDSFSAIKAAEEHRQFWKPKSVKTLLLAESHVYTSDFEVAVKLKYPNEDNLCEMPEQFVRLVYCLGRGESSLAPSIEKNRGVAQFWKVLTACVSDSPEINYDPILKGKTKNTLRRLQNKVSILNKLKDRGIWLLDASIVGLYNAGDKATAKEMRYIIPYCWDNYTSKIIEHEIPGHIIVIGYGVTDLLRERLIRMGIPFTRLPQPQARLPKHIHERAMKTYQRICNR